MERKVEFTMRTKKLLAMAAAALMAFSVIFSSVGTKTVNAAETMENENTKFVVVDMNDVIDGEAVAYATNPTATKVLSKDYASSTGQTGTIYSIGQNVDFSKVIPNGATIKSITIYCPTGTKVTQSKYTTIKNYVITSYATNTSATVPFQQTSKPSSTNKTTAFEGEAANVKFLVRIEGRILQQYTGMDGFTVFGSKMIVEYEEN